MSQVFTLASDLELAEKMIVSGATATQGKFYTVGSVSGFAFTTVPDPEPRHMTDGGSTAGTSANAVAADVIPDGLTSYTLIVKARRVIALKANGAISQGTVLYHHNTNFNVTTSSSGATKCGYALADAASSDTTIPMAFDGLLASVE